MVWTGPRSAVVDVGAKGSRPHHHLNMYTIAITKFALRSYTWLRRGGSATGGLDRVWLQLLNRVRVVGAVGKVVALVAVGSLAPYVCCRLYDWVRRELRSQVLIGIHDNEAQLALAEVMHFERQVAFLPAPVAGLPTPRFRPRRFESLASAFAHEAYLQFGHRTRSEANEIITRKFLRDLALEHKDLRARDASAIVDVALHLSFLPSLALRDVNRSRRTISHWLRSQDGSSRGWLDWLFANPTGL